jgi:hypothetical protein
MVIKTFEYNVLNSFSQQTETTEKKTFSLDVAEKATYIVHRALRTANRNRSQRNTSQRNAFCLFMI